MPVRRGSAWSCRLAGAGGATLAGAGAGLARDGNGNGHCVGERGGGSRSHGAAFVVDSMAHRRARRPRLR
ncbi:hypothetical protein RR42_m4074 [Cupriavidus basilensis]|uniref:Uncharacterized protein n=1 Tax=Cupriavidus basilensis TaxID=68895 RepID=A0A0C4Y7L5_9BURK|nr:hypothetical protein RR42_m4074 [Cupriavidus basilensis]